MGGGALRDDNSKRRESVCAIAVIESQEGHWRINTMWGSTWFMAGSVRIRSDVVGGDLALAESALTLVDDGRHDRSGGNSILGLPSASMRARMKKPWRR